MNMLWTADETALDLVARHPTRGFFTGLRFLDAPVAGAHGHGGAGAGSGGYQSRHVVEVSGNHATPKSLVLLHAIAAFLTRDAGSVEASMAIESKVVVFDHECELSAPALLRILKAKLTHLPGSEQEIEPTALALMHRVSVYRCRDTFQWLATLNDVHFQLLDASPAPLLVVINCVGSFQAIDKMVARAVGDGLALIDQLFATLRQFVRQHSAIVIAAKRTASAARASWDSAEYMPRSWSAQVSKRIQLRTRPPSEVVADQEERERDASGFEARSFVDGKSAVFSFSVDGVEIVEEMMDELRGLYASSSIPSTPAVVSSIAEADTNAAQLWMQ